jgi:outer membrane lipoprotein SlyB
LLLLPLAAIALAGAPGTMAAACPDCGKVVSVNMGETEGKASGVGAVAGGVGGALVGSQIGKGRGNTAMTVVGAAGGAYAGHQVEKSMNKKKFWKVVVNMENGEQKNFTYGSQPAFKSGDRVKVRDGKLLLLAD